MNSFHVNIRRSALCFPQVGEWVTHRHHKYTNKYAWISLRALGLKSNHVKKGTCLHFNQVEPLTDSSGSLSDLRCQHALTLILAWLNNYIHCTVWDGITYPFTNFNGTTIRVWEWIVSLRFGNGLVLSYPTFYWACDYLFMPRFKLNHAWVECTENTICLNSWWGDHIRSDLPGPDMVLLSQGEIFLPIDNYPRQLNFGLFTIEYREFRIMHYQIYILTGIFIQPGCWTVDMSSPV